MDNWESVGLWNGLIFEKNGKYVVEHRGWGGGVGVFLYFCQMCRLAVITVMI